MPTPRVPIIQTILRAWADAFRAIRAMPVVALSALAILVTLVIARFFAVPAILLNPGRSVDQWLQSPTWFAFEFFYSCILIVLLAPLAIAIQRHVVRHEVARVYPLYPLKPSYLGYVGTALALNLAYRLPDLISVLAPARETLPLIVNVCIVVVTFLLMLVVVVITLRKIALFPAIAVNAPNATWHAFASADAGNTFRITLTLLGVVVPGVVCSLLMTFGLPLPHPSNTTGGLVQSLPLALLYFVNIAVASAAAGRIYMALAEPAEALAARTERPAIA
jgi:hypothetical protein